MPGNRPTECSECKRIIYPHIPHCCGEDSKVDILGVTFQNAKAAQEAINDALDERKDNGWR